MAPWWPRAGTRIDFSRQPESLCPPGIQPLKSKPRSLPEASGWFPPNERSVTKAALSAVNCQQAFPQNGPFLVSSASTPNYTPKPRCKSRLNQWRYQKHVRGGLNFRKPFPFVSCQAATGVATASTEMSGSLILRRPSSPATILASASSRSISGSCSPTR